MVYVATPSEDTVSIASHTTDDEEVVVVTGMVMDADPMMVVPVVWAKAASWDETRMGVIRFFVFVSELDPL